MKNDKKNRVIAIQTKAGSIITPTYVPVATNAAIKGCDSQMIDEIGIDLMFVNTYHMLVHPGPNIVEKAGGLHTFMNRKYPIITDSGGFQIFSLQYGGVHEEIKSKGKKITKNSVLSSTEEGVLFRSYRDGSKILVTPESTIEAQKKLDSDIIIPLDELLPYNIPENVFHKSFEKTHRWQIRSLQSHLANKKGQLIYCVIHGGTNEEYRKKSAKILREYDFDGFAIGGSLGTNLIDIKNILDWIMPLLPPEKPRHLLGIADLPSISLALACGIDTFDSAYPTKCARHGWLFTDQGPIKITQTKWIHEFSSFSDMPRLKPYSYAYLHHLFKTHEQIAGMFASAHNLWYLNQYCKKIQNQILK